MSKKNEYVAGLSSGKKVGLKEAKSVRKTQFQLVTRTFSSLMSPWQMPCLCACWMARSSWNAIQVFSRLLRKGRVLMRSYSEWFTYWRTMNPACSVS